MIRTLLLAAALVGVPVLCACQAGSGGSRAARDPVAEAAATTPTPMRFRRLRSMLDDALRISRQGTAAAVRARGPAISREGLALIKATLPRQAAAIENVEYFVICRIREHCESAKKSAIGSNPLGRVLAAEKSRISISLMR